MLWSRNDSEQSRIKTGGISGMLSRDRSKPEVGFFVNDAGSWKMTYYLRTSAKLQARECARDGSQAFRLTAELRSDAPQSSRRMPISVTGRGVWVRPGSIRVHALVVGPLGGRITAIRVDGNPAPGGSLRYHGRPIATVPRVLPPGETALISVDMVTSPHSAGQPSLRITPGAIPNEMSTGPSACGS
jgi:hypothetical protein